MFEREGAAFRLVGYLEESLRQIDRICDRPRPTKASMSIDIDEIKRIAVQSIERARLLP